MVPSLVNDMNLQIMTFFIKNLHKNGIKFFSEQKSLELFPDFFIHLSNH